MLGKFRDELGYLRSCDIRGFIAQRHPRRQYASISRKSLSLSEIGLATGSTYLYESAVQRPMASAVFDVDYTLAQQVGLAVIIVTTVINGILPRLTERKTRLKSA